MLSRRLIIGTLGILLSFVTPASAENDVLHFDVKGTNPGGKGGYAGEVTLTKTSTPQSANIRWVTGTNNAVTDGIALRTNDAVGAGYGGKSFYALAVYQLDGNRIHATWALATKPESVGNYDLKGSDFEGGCPFTDGSSGKVTFTQGKNGAYKISWDLPSGHFDGIGLRVKDTLVAASGDMSGDFGVVALQPSGDEIKGVWTTNGLSGVGTETWALKDKAPLAGGGPAAVGDGKSVTFAGETYFLKDQKSAPGQPISEIREYLREGEDWDGYRKMVAFRMQNVKATAAEFAETLLQTTKTNFPGAYTKTLESSDDSATVFFIIVKGDDAELNLWNIRRTKDGLPSAQFVMRNKPPYDSQEKFKAEQDKDYDEWNVDIKKLGAQADKYLAATAGNAASTSESPKKDNGATPDLADAVKADLDKCGGLAQKFMGLLQEGKTKEATGLFSESAFKKVSREDFVAALDKSNKTLGALQDLTPDKGATDFGVKDGVMTFKLQADSQYEHGKVRETLIFIRNAKGGIELLDYDRKMKE